MLIKNLYFPIISFDEANELWKLFEGVLSSNKPLIYYPVGIEIPKEAKKLFGKNK